MVANCPNKSHEHWKKLVDRIGEVQAMMVYKRNGETIPDMSQYGEDVDILSQFPPERTTLPEVQEKFARKKAVLSQSLNAEVILDTTIEGAGQLETGGEKPSIRVNPNYMGGDTLIHEYGHLYIDLLGGMSNSMIRQGRKYLDGTQLEQDITDQYPELSGERLDKEILSTAIGREGEGIWEANQGTTYQRFKKWLELFFNRIKKTLGLNYNVALDLANQLLTNQVAEQLKSELQTDIQQQKSSATGPLMSQADRVNEVARVMSDIKSSLVTKMGRYNQILNKETSTESQEKAVNELQKLVEEFGKKDDVEAMMHYISAALTETQQMVDRLRRFQNGEIRRSSKRLNDIHEYVQAYSHAQKIRNLLESDADLYGKFREETLSEEHKKTALEALDEVVENHSRIKNMVKTQAKFHMADQLSKRDGRVHARFREQYRRQFKEQNTVKRPMVGSTTYMVDGQQVSKDEFQRLQKQFVNEKMADNADIVQQRERQYWLELFKAAPSDVSSVKAFWFDPSMMSDDLIQEAHSMLEEADFKAMRDSITKFKDADDLFVQYHGVHPESNQKEKYDMMIEDEVDENGNKTGEKSQHLTGRYYSKVYEIHQDFYARRNKAKKEGNKKEFKKIKVEHEKWMEKNLKTVAGETRPVDKWKNPQWDKLQSERRQDTITGKMFDHIVELREESDRIYPDRQNLERKMWGATFRKLPSINANNVERVSNKGFFHATKESVRDIFKIRAEDVEYRPEQVEEEGSSERELAKEQQRIIRKMGDESGGVSQTIPVYFRTDLDKSDQSYDLLSAHLLDNAMAVNYKQKALIHADLELIKTLSERRNIQQKKNIFSKGYYRIVNAFSAEGVNTQEDLVTKGQNSNAHKALNSLIESRLYGIKKLGDEKINKLVDAVNSYTGDVMLIGNHLTATANMLHGSIMNWIESVGGEHFTQKNLKNAEQKYWADSPAWMQDIGRRRPYSKTDLLNEKYNTFGDWRPVSQRFVQDSRAKQMAEKSTLHGLMNMAEHYIQSKVMYAMLDKMRVKDADGNYLGRNEDGEVVNVDSAEDAMSLDEAHYVEDGRLKLEEKVDKVEGPVPGSEEYDNQTDKEIYALMRDVNMDLQGNYDTRQQSQSSRRWYGRSFQMLRGWLFRGIHRRWEGISTVALGRADQKGDLDVESIRDDERMFSKARKDFKSGIYTDFFRMFFGNNILENLREGGVKGVWEIVRSDWNTMSEREHANVKRAITEFAMMGLAVASAYILKGLASDIDDDDEAKREALYYTVFLTKRLHSELAFYINPQETLRIMRSPAASISMLENTLHLYGQIMSDFPWVTGMERYERGKRAGEMKIMKDLRDVAPVFNQLDRTVEEAAGWLFKNQLI